MIPAEVHIQLIVQDAQALPGLRVTAANLLKAAQRSVDPEAIEYLHRAYYCVCAVEAAYARFRDVEIERQTDAVHALPGLCRDWCSLIEDMQWPENDRQASFPGLASLSAGQVVGDLVQDAVARSSLTEERAMHFQLERDGNGEWVAGVDALAPPSLVEGRLQSLWRRLRGMVAAAARRSASAGAPPDADPEGAVIPT